VLHLLVQFGGARFHPGHPNLLAPVVLIAFTALFAAAGLPLIEAVVSRVQRGVRRRRRRRRQRRAAERAEARARAVMSELCPFGWTAQLMLGGRGEVTLQWAEHRHGDRRPAVMRQVHAATIAEALDAMVADRQTDETLEQIEQQAFTEGVAWPEP
jgi:hypothetical protein